MIKGTKVLIRNKTSKYGVLASIDVLSSDQFSLPSRLPYIMTIVSKVVKMKK